MAKLAKRIRLMREKFDLKKQYDIEEVLFLLKKSANSKFVESVDVSVNLGIDVRNPEQNIRGIAILPHGIGRAINIAVFAQGIDAKAAKDAGAKLVGMENLVEEIKKNKLKFDIIIASTEAMKIVSQLSQILGPRGLMPNPKLGTVTSDVAKAVEDAKIGQIIYRNDKNGIIHTIIGKINFDNEKLKENLETFLASLKKFKPAQFKGIFIKKISISTTMGLGFIINQAKINVLL